MSPVITLPDTLSEWPWRSRLLNPYYEDVGKESADWIASFGVFDSKIQSIFDKCKFNLLAGLAYSSLDREGYRVGCDLMNIFFLFDEYTDVKTASEVKEFNGVIMDALSNPHKPRPQGEWVGGEIARQFWARAKESATPSLQIQFLITFNDWLQSLVGQAEDRDKSRLRDIDSYIKLRRVNIGLFPSLRVNEFGRQLPDEVRDHPVIERLEQICADPLVIGNDLISYNKEQARGDDKHNIVAIVMDQQQIDVQSAIYWTAGYHRSLVREFMEMYQRIPRLGDPADLDILTHVDGLGNWVRANIQWSFESERYFGNRGAEIVKTRTFPLLPYKGPEHVGPSEVNL